MVISRWFVLLLMAQALMVGYSDVQAQVLGVEFDLTVPVHDSNETSPPAIGVPVDGDVPGISAWVFSRDYLVKAHENSFGFLVRYKAASFLNSKSRSASVEVGWRRSLVHSDRIVLSGGLDGGLGWIIDDGSDHDSTTNGSKFLDPLFIVEPGIQLSVSINREISFFLGARETIYLRSNNFPFDSGPAFSAGITYLRW